MHGNVWEWVQDTWHSGYDGAPTNGSVWESRDDAYWVYRGGGWNLNARGCRSAYRYVFDPGNRYGSLGFRLIEET